MIKVIKVIISWYELMIQLLKNARQHA